MTTTPADDRPTTATRVPGTVTTKGAPTPPPPPSAVTCSTTRTCRR